MENEENEEQSETDDDGSDDRSDQELDMDGDHIEVKVDEKALLEKSFSAREYSRELFKDTENRP